MERFAEKCACCGKIKKNGDCASAVIASLMELPLSEVPFFAESKHGWWFWLNEWLERRGWVIEHVKRADLPMAPVWASGKSPRGFEHAVVWEGGPNGRVVHDPHPSRAGISDPGDFHVLRPATKVCAGCGREDEPAKPPAERAL